MKAARKLWDFHVLPSWAGQADVIIALGSHDLRVADHAAQKMRAKIAPVLVVTGGSGKVTGGIWHEPEAEAYARVAITQGVPADAIIKESASTNTTDNFVNSRALLENAGRDIRTGVIVCKPYMARRSMAVATKQWPQVDWHVSLPEIDFDAYPSDDTPLVRMINLMVGDLQRLDVYADAGFQTPQEIPDDVWDAYHYLVDRGYDSFVIRN